MKKILTIVFSLILVAGVSTAARTGTLDPAWGPQSGSRMHSLNDLYNYLTFGTETGIPETFQEPISGPAAGTTWSVESIYDDITRALGKCNADYDMIIPNLPEGYYFFCTDTNYWGVQEGTIPPPPWALNETTCNALSGWHWYTTNGRSGCWSKALADSVSWNKGVGNDSDNPGGYTAATGYTLQERMEAAAAGEWYKIVSDVDGTTITSAHNGSDGYSVISALAIADCIDGVRDLCSTNGCLGSSWSTINTSLRSWAGAAGKSALTYLGNDAGSSGNNDYETACEQSSSDDLPLGCSEGLFDKNRKVCGDGDSNYSWAAACGHPSGDGWDTSARLLGGGWSSKQGYSYTTSSGDYMTFRVVVRPAAE